MKVRDNSGNIVALIFDINNYNDEKSFLTDDEDEIQLGIFNLEKNNEILRHRHPQQLRNISKTSEVIILLSGQLEVSLFNFENKLIKTIKLDEGKIIIFVQGGHSLKILETSKFIEVKQGPYDSKLDKIIF
jgi:cupin fold WbuC family metalloprotein